MYCGLRDLRLIRYAEDFVVLARSRRQLERVVLPELRDFLAARGSVRAKRKQGAPAAQGKDFVRRHFKRFAPMKFLMRLRRSSIWARLYGPSLLFRNRALPVGVPTQKTNAIIRGFYNHYRTAHSSKAFRRLTLY